jgi:hypothetical protein
LKSSEIGIPVFSAMARDGRSRPRPRRIRERWELLEKEEFIKKVLNRSGSFSTHELETTNLRLRT